MVTQLVYSELCSLALSLLEYESDKWFPFLIISSSRKLLRKDFHSCFQRWQRMLSDTRRLWQSSSKNGFNLCVASSLSYGCVKTVLYYILVQSPPWTTHTPLSLRYAFKCFFLQKIMAFHKGKLSHFQNRNSVLQPVFTNILSILNIWFPVNIRYSKNCTVSHLKNCYLWFYFLTQNKIP